MNLEKYRNCEIRIEMLNDHIKVLEEYEHIVDLSEQLKDAYTERDELEQERENIKEFIKNIPNERYRVMFYLYYCKNYTKRAIAEYLNISEAYLYKLWKKAVKEVKAYE